jgi:hypothetical protein
MNLLQIPRIIKNWSYAKDIEYTNNFEQNKVSFGRRFARQYTKSKLWEKSFLEFNLVPDKEEPVLGNLLMNHYEDNACTHIHKDSAPEGYVHVRANVLLKKPNRGGDIIIEDKIFSIEENDLWIIFASLENHGSTPIEKGERLIYSFGSLIKLESIKKIL